MVADIRAVTADTLVRVCHVCVDFGGVAQCSQGGHVMAKLGKEIALTEIEVEIMAIFVRRRILGDMAVAGLLDQLVLKLVENSENEYSGA